MDLNAMARVDVDVSVNNNNPGSEILWVDSLKANVG